MICLVYGIKPIKYFRCLKCFSHIWNQTQITFLHLHNQSHKVCLVSLTQLIYLPCQV
jgi:hypothetical protein